ncbi:hypothetical protein [Leifsonia sp. Leaf264]|uniref:hypothetical protein n=1 Tax=Leifsonia sp. Leaf264 TaxID=1736314 RepID=UPI0006F55414|nr:hypothetical protein [Leifsonia sp. Leaf264]KQO98662.1 hypothetical protein ASF30_11410 [Leifsonia sp. Leaf264]
MADVNDRSRHDNGQFATEAETKTAAGQLDGLTAAPTIFTIDASMVRAGDSVFLDGEFVGHAMQVSPKIGGGTSIRIHNGGIVTADEDDVVGIERATQPMEWDENLTYWDKVYYANHQLTDTDGLQHILDTEAEDDFMFAVASHRNATPDQIEQASKHHSLWVRTAALDNPLCPQHTAKRILAESLHLAEAERAVIHKEGRNPMTPYREEQVKAYVNLADLATARLDEFLAAARINEMLTAAEAE